MYATDNALCQEIADVVGTTVARNRDNEVPYGTSVHSPGGATERR